MRYADDRCVLILTAMILSYDHVWCQYILRICSVSISERLDISYYTVWDCLDAAAGDTDWFS